METQQRNVVLPILRDAPQLAESDLGADARLRPRQDRSEPLVTCELLRPVDDVCIGRNERTIADRESGPQEPERRRPS